MITCSLDTAKSQIYITYCRRSFENEEPHRQHRSTDPLAGRVWLSTILKAWQTAYEAKNLNK